MSIKSVFQMLKTNCPKLKPQFITPRLAYMAKDEILDEVYIKLDRTSVVVLSRDGTYSFTDSNGLQKKVRRSIEIRKEINKASKHESKV